MKENPIKRLYAHGQSVWLDYISHQLIASGKLSSMMEEDGLMGMTSNPTIFEKAIAGSSDYDDIIREMAAKEDALTIYEAISQKDVQSAADVFLPVYEKTKGKDGYVSLEVNPHLAFDTEGTIEEARRLFAALDRPNIMIKVPATEQGLSAIEQLTSEGISINATLIFGLSQYKKVAEAYIAGLEKRLDKGQSIANVHSVASFFISRIDSSVDAALEKITGEKSAEVQKLLGKTAVANAKAAVLISQEVFGSARFQALRAKGANVQRLLWASTSTKNPKYSDVKYVEELIGENTVNTIPNETLDLYRDHGNPEARLGLNMEEAQKVLADIKGLGIDMDGIVQFLIDDGVNKFNKSFDDLLAALNRRMAEYV